jgi:pimeloyl-ACP methyl ester carboxylesterase
MGHYESTGTATTHWVDYGGSGPLIVLVHGLGGSVVNWDAVGPGLTRVGRTVALDLPGHGLSPPGKDWRLSTHARALEAFVESLGEPVTLVGNSMGGLLSEMVAARRPELVRELVLVSPATPPRFPDPRIHWPTVRLLAAQATPVLGDLVSRRFWGAYTPGELVRLSLGSITHRPGRVPLDVVEALVRSTEARSRLPWAPRAVPATARSIASLWRRPSRFVATVRAITAPTLVVHGIGDHIVSPTAVEWMCALRPDWELIQMEDTGHTPQLDAPVRFLEVVTPWLERRLGAERRRDDVPAG